MRKEAKERAARRGVLAALALCCAALSLSSCSISYEVCVRAEAGANDSTDVEVYLFWPLTAAARDQSEEAEGYYGLQEALRSGRLEVWDDYEAADLGALSVADDRDCLVLEDVDGVALSQSGDTSQLVLLTTYSGYERLELDLRRAEPKFSGFLGMFQTAYLHVFLEKEGLRAEFVPADEFLGNLENVTALCHPRR